MHDLKKFQKSALSESISRIDLLRKMPDSIPRRYLLSMPCGAGKTVLLARLFDEIAKDSITVVVSPGAGGLAEQTYRALRSQMPADRPVVYLTSPEDLHDVVPGTVFVTNYEKIVTKYGEKHELGGEYKSRLTRHGEVKNFWDMLDTARGLDIPVIVAVDEAHYASKTSASSIPKFFNRVEEVLGYKPLRIETTATPDSKRNTGHGYDEYVVKRNAVAEEGLIRKAIILNPGAKDSTFDAQDDEDLFLLNLHYETWCALRTEAHTLGLPTPLMTFCVSNGANGDEDMRIVKDYLASVTDPVTGLPIVEGNGTLAVQLDKEKVNVDDMEAMRSASSPVVALIFKQAIAMGWDCPRAQTMHVMRDIISSSFKEQLLGRIARQPGAKHTGSDLLDYAYVFAAVAKNFEVPKEVKGQVYTDHEMKVMPIHPEHLKAWTAHDMKSRRNVRENTGGRVTSGLAYDAIKHLDFEPVHGAHDSLATYTSDAAITDLDRDAISAAMNDAQYAKEAFYQTDRRKVIETIRDAAAARGMGPAQRFAEMTYIGLRNWATDTGHEEFVKDPYGTIAANLDEPGMKDVIDTLVTWGLTATANRNIFKDGKDRDWAPVAQRIVHVRHDVDTPDVMEFEGRMAELHAYGSPAEYKRSRPEERFENDVFRHADTVDPKFSATLFSFFKNETGLAQDENGKPIVNVWSLTYSRDEWGTDTRGKKYEVFGTAEPDYLTLLRNEDGKTFAIAFEVKDSDLNDLSGNGTTFQKARGMVRYTEAHRSDDKPCAAALVYKKGGSEWTVVLDGNMTDKATSEIPLSQWLSDLLTEF